LTKSIDLFDFFDWTNQPVGAQSACSRRFSSRREDASPKKTVATEWVEAAVGMADCAAWLVRAA
jgi:hypothetical protein